MPSISTLVYPAPGYVRVEVNWADVGTATGAAVYRVDCVTGARTPLRPYVSFTGDFLDLSCGYGIFWDTEAPLDKCFYYCTQAINAAGDVVTTAADNLVTDTFDRVVVDGFGSTNNGLPYTLDGGTNPGNYDVNSSKGQFTMDSVGVFRRAFVDTGLPTQDVMATAKLPVVPVGASIALTLMARRTDNNNQYRAILLISTAGAPSLSINRTVGGVGANIASATPTGTHVAGDAWTIRIQVWGSQLRAKAWKSTDVQPDWQATVTDTSLASGTFAGLEDRLEAGNGNGTTVISWDDFTVTDPCADLKVIESCSDDLVVPSSSEFRLGDPMRPCNDVTLQFVPTADPECVPTQGIFFGSMSDEEAPANSGTFEPVNSEFPIGAYRTRMSLTATLTVLARTFADRDALRRLNKPGGALLIRGPAQYGIDDRYMLAGATTEHRALSDHRIQPRAVAIPHVQLGYPYGPSQGVCGARVQDLCDIYTSWDAIVAAGLTYADLLRGKASNDTPLPATDERTWTQVNALYASWNAELAANADWDTLREGT